MSFLKIWKQSLQGIQHRYWQIIHLQEEEQTIQIHKGFEYSINDITDRSDLRENPYYNGVCHISLSQEGHCRPGEVLFGIESHTCNAGAFGQFASGIAYTDARFIMGTGKLLVKLPATLTFVMYR